MKQYFKWQLCFMRVDKMPVLRLC